MMKLLEKIKSPKATKRNIFLALLYMSVMTAIFVAALAWHFAKK